MALGKAVVNITANLAPLKRGLASARLLVGTAMKRFASGVLGGIASVVRRTMATITRVVKRTVKIATVALIAIGIASVKMASDAREANNLFEVSFGSLTSEMEDWTRRFANALKLNQTTVKGFVGTFQLMLVSMGFGAKQASEMSKRLTELTVDLASLRNLGFEDAFTKISAGLIGEIRPLRRVGVLIDENTIKTQALVDGIIKEGEELTQTQKVMARFQAMIKQTSRDTGDFAKTRDEGNNVFKTFGEILKQTSEIIGDELLPSVQKAFLGIRDWLDGNRKQIGLWTRTMVDKITEFVQIAEGELQSFLHIAKFDGLPAAIKDSIQRAVAVIKEIFNENKPQLQEFMLDLGVSLGKSLNAGIKKAFIENLKLQFAGPIGIKNIISAEIEAQRLRGVAGQRGVQLQPALPFTKGAQRVPKVGEDLN